MKNLNKLAWNILFDKKISLSMFTSLDLALLSNKKIAFKISLNDYIELTSAFSLILDNPNILVLPNIQKNPSVEGFLSIHDKLIEKLSYVMTTNLSQIKIIIFVESIIAVNYLEILEAIKITSNINYSLAIKKLNLAGFEKVDFVETPSQYCLKGGIIDIYSPVYSKPLRLCLYDDSPSLKFYNSKLNPLRNRFYKKFNREYFFSQIQQLRLNF